jgi:hypothetical protein
VVVKVPAITTVRPGQAANIAILAFDPENRPMTASLTGAGPSFSFPVENNLIQFSLDLPVGTHALSVSVSDGVNTTEEPFSIIVVNAPPVIVAPPSRGAFAFSAPLPDFVPQTVVSDDTTPTAQIVVTQSPAPGTVVLHGPGAIVTLTARDAQGNTATATTQFIVGPVVSVGGIVKYQIYPSGQNPSPFPVLVAGTPASAISSTKMIVDGVVRRTVAGLMTAEPLILPSGAHTIVFEVTNAAGLVSSSEPIVFGVSTSTNPGPLSLDPDDGGQIVLRFSVPVGVNCCIQFSENLRDWTTIHTIIGMGTEVAYPVTPTAAKGFYRLLYP